MIQKILSTYPKSNQDKIPNPWELLDISDKILELKGHILLNDSRFESIERVLSKILTQISYNEIDEYKFQALKSTLDDFSNNIDPLYSALKLSYYTRDSITTYSTSYFELQRIVDDFVKKLNTLGSSSSSLDIGSRIKKIRMNSKQITTPLIRTKVTIYNF
jgi:hypothetical protein